MVLVFGYCTKETLIFNIFITFYPERAGGIDCDPRIILYSRDWLHILHPANRWRGGAWKNKNILTKLYKRQDWFQLHYTVNLVHTVLLSYCLICYKI